jgi:hypothetical protein
MEAPSSSVLSAPFLFPPISYRYSATGSATVAGADAADLALDDAFNLAMRSCQKYPEKGG